MRYRIGSSLQMVIAILWLVGLAYTLVYFYPLFSR